MKHTTFLLPANNAFPLAQPRLFAPGSRSRRTVLRYASTLSHQLTRMPLRQIAPAAAIPCAALIPLGAIAYWNGLLLQACLLAITLGTALALNGLRCSVREVALAAKRISAGDRSVRVPRWGAVGEIGELVRNFNGMAAALDSWERQRSQVAAGVSHELRTPLTILMGRLHAIRDGVIEGEPAETERLLRQVEHIMRIVDDLDALALADAGRLMFEREYLELEDVIRPVVTDLQPLLAQHDLKIDARCRRVLINGDRHRLRQVFTNILTNAAKHSPRGGRIQVMLDVRDGQAVASVIDEGPGIEPADMEHIFKPFWRSAASRRRPGCSGTGIGLALTDKLVSAHGGHVEVANRQDRSGACFRVVLPLA